MYDFIPNNDLAGKDRLTPILKAFLYMNRGVYDGRNQYAPKKGVYKFNGEDKYTFMNDEAAKNHKREVEFLFYPTSEELRTALAVYKEKGYYPYYDNSVCEYGYVKDKSEVRGEYTIRHTQWL